MKMKDGRRRDQGLRTTTLIRSIPICLKVLGFAVRQPLPAADKLARTFSLSSS